MISLATGERIGTYQISEFLGRGGFALTYLAKGIDCKEVVLKIGDVAGGGRYVARCNDITSESNPKWISPDEVPAEAIFFKRDGARIAFLDAREIDALVFEEGNLLRNSPNTSNLVQMRECFTHEGRTVLVLEYVRGETLREKIRALEGIKLNWFLTLTRTLQRLAKTHKGKLRYHGDLKPENLIVTPWGRIVMIDPAPRLTDKGTITTTPHYNPLLLHDRRADIMGIGIMLYEILTGVLPFSESPWKYAGRGQGGEVERCDLSYFLSYTPIQDLNPNAHRELCHIAFRCITDFGYDLSDLERDLVIYLEANL